MDLNKLKHVTAANLIKLRGEAGLTQAELGAMLNYSDKTISKWERGEAIPDAFVLKQLSALYKVTVDQLLSPVESWRTGKSDPEENIEENIKEEKPYSEEVIIALSVLSVWTAGLMAFVILWLFDLIFWQIFLICLPVSMLLLLVLLCVFKRHKALPYVIAAFVLSIFIMLYFFIPFKNPWQIFLVCIPAVGIVFLACNVKKRPVSLKKIKDKVTGTIKRENEQQSA